MTISSWNTILIAFLFAWTGSAFTLSNPRLQLNSRTTAWKHENRIGNELMMVDGDDSNSVEIPSNWRDEVLSTLSNVKDPDLNNDIVSLGFVENLSIDVPSRTVSFDVVLTTPACPVKDQFEQQCTDLVSALEWTQDVQVTMTAEEIQPNTANGIAGMNQIGAVIAVSSCKGGVGKSTTAVNLAFAMRSLGASVGIFDADFYGPSLPTMITPSDDNVRFVGRQVAPLERGGVKLMSFGYVNEGSAVMRGPMVTQLLDQFLSLTDWGKLDYLIIDMPPGTGDIQLTLSQRLNITAAVIVTTPQELSFVDVERGIEMFDTVNVPCVAVVENMAYLETESKQKPSVIDTDKLYESFFEKLKENDIKLTDGKSLEDFSLDLVNIVNQQQSEGSNEETVTEQVRIFGPGHKQRLSNQWGIEHTFSIPLLQNIASNGDSGTPYILEFPESSQSKTYLELGASVVQEVSKFKYSQTQSRPSVSYDEASNRIIYGEISDYVSSAELRRSCKCAMCVEELSGRQILRPEDVSENIRPLKIEPCGNYATSIDWSDGHRSLYPYRQLRSLINREPIEESIEDRMAV